MEKTKKLVIIGAKEIANMAYEYFTWDSEYEVAAFAVHRQYITTETFRDLPVIPLEELINRCPPDDFFCFVAASSEFLNRKRAALYHDIKKEGYRFASYISSRAFVWRNVEIGENCFILENNTLQPFVKIGNNVTLWSGNHIGHQARIADNCFLTSQVVISGYVDIGENTFMGVNAAVADNIKIGRDNFIGMGAVVNKTSKDDQILLGNPAKPSPVSAKTFCSVKE
ncbi:MAG: acetyltransferase [Spirochaetaceae bacterium]|jgi:sugar O-acyltransferase (sialic acid O-acetyltransferase NeuD family)|nr:acetyltransferase [Spirochaetaceae bacterium]